MFYHQLPVLPCFPISHACPASSITTPHWTALDCTALDCTAPCFLLSIAHWQPKSRTSKSLPTLPFTATPDASVHACLPLLCSSHPVSTDTALPLSPVAPMKALTLNSYTDLLPSYPLSFSSTYFQRVLLSPTTPYLSRSLILTLTMTLLIDPIFSLSLGLSLNLALSRCLCLCLCPCLCPCLHFQCYTPGCK